MVLIQYALIFVFFLFTFAPVFGDDELDDEYYENLTCDMINVNLETLDSNEVDPSFEIINETWMQYQFIYPVYPEEKSIYFISKKTLTAIINTEELWFNVFFNNILTFNKTTFFDLATTLVHSEMEIFKSRLWINNKGKKVSNMEFETDKLGRTLVQFQENLKLDLDEDHLVNTSILEEKQMLEKKYIINHYFPICLEFITSPGIYFYYFYGTVLEVLFKSKIFRKLEVSQKGSFDEALLYLVDITSDGVYIFNINHLPNHVVDLEGSNKNYELIFRNYTSDTITTFHIRLYDLKEELIFVLYDKSEVGEDASRIISGSLKKRVKNYISVSGTDLEYSLRNNSENTLNLTIDQVETEESLETDEMDSTDEESEEKGIKHNFRTSSDGDVNHLYIKEGINGRLKSVGYGKYALSFNMKVYASYDTDYPSDEVMITNVKISLYNSSSGEIVCSFQNSDSLNNLTCINCNLNKSVSDFEEYSDENGFLIFEMIPQHEDIIENGEYIIRYSFNVIINRKSEMLHRLKYKGHRIMVLSSFGLDKETTTEEFPFIPVLIVVTSIVFIGTSVTATAGSCIVLKTGVVGTKIASGVIPLLFGKYVVTKSGDHFQLIDVSYKFVHKKIKLKDESQSKRDFLTIFKSLRASKYSAYSHCKYCFKEQHDGSQDKLLGNGEKHPHCVKCGLPLINYLTFEKSEMFCVLCAMMNKYDHNNHGRCLLHLTAPKKRVGATYYLYKTNFSVSSASKKKKASQSLRRLKTITSDPYWKLNSAMRFEFLYLFRRLVGKELVQEDEREGLEIVKLIQETINEIKQRRLELADLNRENVKEIVYSDHSLKLQLGSIEDNLKQLWFKHIDELFGITLNTLNRHLKILVVFQKKKSNKRSRRIVNSTGNKKVFTGGSKRKKISKKKMKVIDPEIEIDTISDTDSNYSRNSGQFESENLVFEESSFLENGKNNIVPRRFSMNIVQQFQRQHAQTSSRNSYLSPNFLGIVHNKNIFSAKQNKTKTRKSMIELPSLNFKPFPGEIDFDEIVTELHKINEEEELDIEKFLDPRIEMKDMEGSSFGNSIDNTNDIKFDDDTLLPDFTFVHGSTFNNSNYATISRKNSFDKNFNVDEYQRTFQVIDEDINDTLPDISI